MGKRYFLVYIIIFCAAAGVTFGATPAQRYVERIAGNELKEAMLGVMVMSSEGDTVACLNSDKVMIPASTMKLVSTGLALHALGSDFVYETSLVRTGPIKDGVLLGDLYIVGRGDPMLASDDSIATEASELFSRWAGMIEDAGIREIRGYIVGDDRYFKSMPEGASWQFDDCGTYYGTGASGLNFYENIQNFMVSAPATVQDRPNITVGYPYCPWMEFNYDNCYGGAAGTGDKLYYYTSRYAPYGEMRGTFAIDRGTKVVECSNKFPAYTCAWHFCEYLAGKGVNCTGGAADLGYFRPEDLSVSGMIAAEDCAAARDRIAVAEKSTVGKTQSPELKAIAKETNYVSNNLYAETLRLTLGKTLCGDDALAAAAVNKVLDELGVPHGAVSMVDGSGLSRQNLLSPNFLCAFLEAMKESPAFEDFLYSLPSPGKDGTMTYVMRDYDRAQTSRIFLKSGSMTGVKCFSGYVIPDGGKVEDAMVFAIMINNSLLSQARLQKLVDGFLYLIANS